MFEDLKWFGFEWQEGPDIGGASAPYAQSQRTDIYRAALEKLRATGRVYPCDCSRKDIAAASRAPHAEDDNEPIYPGTCRGRGVQWPAAVGSYFTETNLQSHVVRCPSLRFRVADGETVSFTDNHLGPQSFVAGKDFGDFVVWRPDDVPAYQLACVVDDAAMQISEVVRGRDLLVSTARQLLIFRALSLSPPEFFHCELMTDDAGARLAKRHDALSLRTLRERGEVPADLRRDW